MAHHWWCALWGLPPTHQAACQVLFAQQRTLRVCLCWLHSRFHPYTLDL